ncbi:hypothetical protein FE246_06060 [Aliarcobacter thereius]|uniref:Uncharacterized protein n=1 Tax=Aliarcobacter thereius TaxID=544718 RepID=A0A5R9H6G2_9BACT|nr:hypothetical protein [Aliarcobacter thereius]TLS71986.1 hypothetical protein FE246_06060 [Aliarcobacter thereius]
MFNFIKKFFNIKNKNGIDSFAIKQTNEDILKRNNLLKQIALEEFEKSKFFRKDKKEWFLDYILNEKNILNNTILSVEEKRNLGINTRSKVSKETLDLFILENLDDNIFQSKHPKDFISDFYYRVHFKVNKIIELKRLNDIEVKELKYHITGIHKTCKWCIDKDNKKFKTNEILSLIDKNCLCDYNKSFFEPIILY